MINSQVRFEIVFYEQEDFYSHDSLATVMHNAQTALLMMSRQATGMASGNHGLFLRYAATSAEPYEVHVQLPSVVSYTKGSYGVRLRASTSFL